MRLTLTRSSAVWAAAIQVQTANATPIGNLISSELRDARLGARAHVELAVPVQGIGEQFLLRVQRLVPSNLLASVGRHPAHDPEHGAGRHALAVVDRLILSNGGEEH